MTFVYVDYIDLQLRNASSIFTERALTPRQLGLCYLLVAVSKVRISSDVRVVASRGP